MIFVMLSPILIILFIVLSVLEEKRRKKNSKEQNSNHVDQQQYDYTDKNNNKIKIQMMINKSEKIVKGEHI